MRDASTDQLRKVVEDLHECKATFADIEPVHEQFKGETVWEGIVHVFYLSGHAKAKVCYAWSLPVDGSKNHRFYTVLAVPPVSSPVEAVRVAILSDLEK